MKKTEKRNPHIGSSVDDFFAEDGLVEKIDVAAVKRVIYESAKYVLLPTV